ncbi:hypothetical protein PoB_002227800 [Plakobranchus ocellatus]|uniref:EF-hand domain-containing protein n=1 Tax=Plakobranchus ocellatus TaxID=259542 RepID=A0AAV3ZMG0_9GAST|nr:hypothetical protein PoB_002227800 [Plakobranchus ocellatus]
MSSDDVDNDEQVKELIDMVMALTDKNFDGVITREEFRDYVLQDFARFELLGKVLPLRSIVDEFIQVIKGKQPHAVSKIFAKERQYCLNEPYIPPKGDSLYPVALEMP